MHANFNIQSIQFLYHRLKAYTTSTHLIKAHPMEIVWHKFFYVIVGA